MNAALRRIDGFLGGLDGHATADGDEQLKNIFLQHVAQAVQRYTELHSEQQINYTSSPDIISHRGNQSKAITGVSISLNSKNFTLVLNRVLYNTMPTSQLCIELDDLSNEAHRKNINTANYFPYGISQCHHNVDGWVNRMPRFVTLWTHSLQTNTNVTDLQELNTPNQLGTLDLQKYTFMNTKKQKTWHIQLEYIQNNLCIRLEKPENMSWWLPFILPNDDNGALTAIKECQLATEDFVYGNADDPDNV